MKALYEMENVAVTIKSEEEYDEFMEMRDGVKWDVGVSYDYHARNVDIFGMELKENFCWDDIDYFQREGYKIISF